TLVRDWIRHSLWRGAPGFRLGVWLRQGPLIGTVGLGGDPVSCAYVIDPAHAGQGHATEAMAAFLDDAFTRFDLTAMVADHFTDNPASGRVLAKLGFVETGHGLGKSAARALPEPNVHYRLTRPARP
ncbi:MAG: GNAT family N-acetyltransferase, partial [Tabrizicola sp.]|nr:GNAT family N-acetyltransferase [Tabrizicola sp.]